MSRGRSGASASRDSSDDRSGDVDVEGTDEDVGDESSYSKPSESAYTASRLGD